MAEQKYILDETKYIRVNDAFKLSGLKSSFTFHALAERQGLLYERLGAGAYAYERDKILSWLDHRRREIEKVTLAWGLTQTARVLGCSKEHITRLVTKGEFPYVYNKRIKGVGESLWIPVNDILAYAEISLSKKQMECSENET